MADTPTNSPGPLTAVLDYGEKNGYAPEVTAKAVQSWRADAHAYGDENGDPEQPDALFEAHDWVDQTAADALKDLQKKGFQSLAKKHFKDEGEYNDFLETLPHSQSNGGATLTSQQNIVYSGQGAEEKQARHNAAREDFEKLSNDPAWQIERKPQYQTIDAPDGSSLASWRLRKAKDGSSQVHVNVHSTDGQLHQTLLKVPTVTDEEHKSEVATAKQKAAESKSKREGVQNSWMENLPGYPNSQATRNLYLQDEIAATKRSQMSKDELQRERIQKAFESNPIAKLAGEHGLGKLGEDVFKELQRAKYNMLYGMANDSERPELKQALEGLDATYGTTTPAGAWNTASSVTKQATAMAPYFIPHIGAPMLALSTFGGSQHGANAAADELEEAAKGMKDKTLADETRKLAKGMRDDAMLYGAMSAANILLAARLVPKIGKTTTRTQLFIGGAAKGAVDWGLISGVQGQLLDPTFAGRRGTMKELLESMAIGGVLGGTTHAMGKPTGKQADTAPPTTPPATQAPEAVQPAPRTWAEIVAKVEADMAAEAKASRSPEVSEAIPPVENNGGVSYKAYHGTKATNPISASDMKEGDGQLGKGIYLAHRESKAEIRGSVGSYTVTLKNPAKFENYSAVTKERIEKYAGNRDKMNQSLRDLGYDGIIVGDPQGMKGETLVFSNDNISNPSREAYAPGSTEATSQPPAPVETQSKPAPTTREPGLEGTSINHADTDRIRADMGLPPEDRSGRVLTNAEAEARATELVESDNRYAEKTYQFYLEHPEARINQVDEAVMYRVQQDQEATFDSLRQELSTLPPDSPRRAELSSKLTEVEDALKITLDMHSRAGSAWSAEGIARQRRAAERINSLPQTLFTVEAKRGKPLEPKERVEIEKAHDAVVKAQAEEAKVTTTDDAKVQSEIKKAIKKTADQKTAKFNDFVDKQIAAAKARLRGQGRLMATIDPLGLVDHAIIGAGYIAKGVVKLSTWTARMISEFGESIRPHLDQIHAMSKAQVETWKKDAISDQVTPESVKADWKGEPITEIHTVAAELAKAHSLADPSLTGQSPEHFKTLTDRVQADLKELGQDLTPSETARAITNYGKQPEPKVSPEQARLRELKAQILVNEKIADAQDQKTPWIRRLFKKPSEEVRRMNTQLQDEVRKIEGAEAQAGRMKTPQQRVISALNNQIKDIEAELAGTAAKRPNRQPITDSPEIAALRAHRDALQAALEAKRDPTGDIGYNERATAAALASAKLYKRKLAEGRYTNEAPPNRQDTIETYAAKFKAERAKEAFRDAAEKSGEPAEERLKSVVAKMSTRINELQTQITTGNKPQGSNGQRYVNKNSPQYKTSAAILKRLRDIISDQRVQNARSARAAADALMRSMDTQIAEMQRIITQRRRAGQTSPQLEAELAALTDQRAVLDAPTIERLKANEEARQKRYTEAEAKIKASGKVPEKLAKRTPEDAVLESKKDATARAKNKLEEAIMKAELAARSKSRKALDAFVSWSRIGKLSHILVLEKLVGAGLENIITNPISRALVQIGRITPTTRAILGKATYEGSIGLKAEGRSIVATIKSFRKDVWDKILHGKSSIDYLYSREKHYPPEFLQIVGNIHGGIKEPVRQGIFARSLKYRMDAAERGGIDWRSDELMQRKMHEAALVDANSDIFMGDNIITKVFHHGVVSALRNSKSTAAHLMADALDIVFPIVNVPTNLAIRGFQMTTGLPEAALRLGKASMEGKLKNRAEGLTEMEAEKIVKAAKYGIIGLLTGYYAWTHNQQFGGFYTQDKKDDNKDGLKYGDSKFGPVTVNHYLGHGPWLTHMNILAQARRIYDRRVAKGESIYDAAVDTAGTVIGEKSNQFPIVGIARRNLRDGQTFPKWVSGTIRDAIIPGIVQDYARSPWADPNAGTTRRPKNYRDEFMLGIPWMRNQVPLAPTKH